MSVRVLVTTDSREGGGYALSPRVRPRTPEFWVKQRYVEAVRRVGGVPLLLPGGELELEAALAGVGAVVLTGGETDIHPSHYGEAPRGRLDKIDAPRTGTELALARLCMERDLPVLGVCGGMQVLAVAAGGSLYQDIRAEIPGAMEHEQPTDPGEPWHEVRFAPGLCREIFGPAIRVNSTHHQAVRDPGPFEATGLALDGVVEAIERPGMRFCIGVQWHPELVDLAPYHALLRRAR